MVGLTLPIWSLPELIAACICWATWFLGLSLKSNDVNVAAIIRSYRLVTFSANVLLSLIFLIHSGLTPAHDTLWWTYLISSTLPPVGIRLSRHARGQQVVPVEVAYWLASITCALGLLIVPDAFVGPSRMNPLGFPQANASFAGMIVVGLQVVAITVSVAGRLGKQAELIGGFRWVTGSWAVYGLSALLEQVSLSGWLVLPPFLWIGSVALALDYARLMHQHQGLLVVELGQSNQALEHVNLALEQSNMALQHLSNDLEQRVLERTHDLHQLAMFDPLTGLANRAQGREFLDHALTEATHGWGSVAVLILDLNKFKNINDTLGHQVGDDVLLQVAQRFEQVVPKGALLTRLGGDEFMLILPEFDPNARDDLTGLGEVEAKAEAVSRALLEALVPAINVDGTEFFLGASIGISVYPSDANDALSLMRHADLAMYQAKHERLGYRRFDAQLDASHGKRLEIERAVRQAIENGPQHSFHLEYQPIVELHSRRISGFEALLRWDNPAFKLGPDQFIPVAEESRMIVPLGTWVLFEACQQAARWQDDGLEAGRIAVNISIHQFTRPDFVETVKRALLTSGLPAHKLTLEFVESVMMDHFEDSAAKIAQLRTLGVLVALDDFGTGYSSLSYLQHLTFDVLKIDRSFTRMLGQTSRPRALIAAALGIAHEFGMTTVVEGVETPEQAKELEGLGCGMAQGYLFSRPVRAAQATQLMRTQHPFSITRS